MTNRPEATEPQEEREYLVHRRVKQTGGVQEKRTDYHLYTSDYHNNFFRGHNGSYG